MYTFLTVPSRIFKEKTFWDEYGLGIIICLCVAAVMTTVFVLTYLHDKKQQRVPLLTMHNGVPVDSARLCTVLLMNYKKVSILKGDVFVAPAPARNGYTFAGWFYDSAFTVPYKSKKIRQSIVLYPKWIKHG